MDVCRFINSKDVAEHLRAAEYQFNAFETVYFVEQFADATLDEKISAWKEIAEAMPNCPTTWSPNYEKCGSTHSFLREYAALQQHMLDEFENKNDFVYAIRSMRCAQRPESDPQNEESPYIEGPWIEGEPLLFSTLANQAIVGACSNPLSMRRTTSLGLRLAFPDDSSFPLPGWRDMEYTPFATWSNPDTPSSSPLEGCASRRIRQRSARRAASNRRTGESLQMNEMPSIGTTLTYGEAIKACNRFERMMLEKAYGAEPLPAVGLYDLL